MAKDDAPVSVAASLRIDVHVHHHFDSPLMVGRARQPAVGAKLTVEEQEMAAVEVNVDTVNETATVSFQDDKGDATAQPDGSVITFSSSDETVFVLTARADNPAVADFAFNSAGTADAGATVTDADGNPLTEADGTPWAPIDPTTVTVDPGAAVGARMSVEGTTV
jgi:hypothetical protein